MYATRSLSLCCSYIYSTTWDDLERTVLRSTTDSPMDELIHLLDASVPNGLVKGLEGVRSLTFRTLESISVRLLPSTNDVVPQTNAIRHPGAPTSLPQPGSASGAVEEGDVVNSAGTDQAVDIAAAQRRVDAAHSVVHDVVSPAKLKVATRLLANYRRSRRHRMVAASSAQLSINISKYLDSMQELPTMSKPYKLYFLGIVPLVLTSLEECERAAVKYKKKASGQMKIAIGDELDDAGKQITWAV